MKAYSCAVAAWFSDPTLAQSAAGVTLLALTLYIGYNIPEPYMIGALRWAAYVCISYRVHCAVRLTVYFFLAAEACVRVDHDKRVQDARLGVFEPRPSGFRLREHHVGKPGLHGHRRYSWTTEVNSFRYLKLSVNYEWTHTWRVRNRFVTYHTLMKLFSHPRP